MSALNENQQKSVPGQDTSTLQKVLNVGTSALQSYKPVKQICQHVCAFHFYAQDMSRQVEAHHYCSCTNDEVRQCVIYDSADSNARLIGIEYIISRRLFESLPEEEKKLWHSHTYEVMSGMLYAPGVPNAAEAAEMAKLVDTYGKTWHTWQVDRGDTLPLGPPQLMMAFTKDGQLKEGLVADRDSRCGKSTAELKEYRDGKLTPPKTIATGANHWETSGGKAVQLELKEVPFKGA
ncbi:hypothetical protein CVIRNUC_010989 [Coccomyxa viridis]|uniref:DUF1264-domain-containing protein n=1 Tax=Coccomyxa viridis TaxID=1274662 RepID=A0AAV1INE9_9CHLO|nr:hypothetical protein CVIRNUC_010989 [Coccomyxa viridis]